MKIVAEMEPRAEAVAGFLKAMASPHRLMVLCQLVEGERCVGELVAATGIAPTSMSQHLGKLREEGIVAVRRDHRTLYYRIEHPAARAVMTVLYEQFCKKDEQ